MIDIYRSEFVKNNRMGNIYRKKGFYAAFPACFACAFFTIAPQVCVILNQIRQRKVSGF
jgi:hypothetical protein